VQINLANPKPASGFTGTTFWSTFTKSTVLPDYTYGIILSNCPASTNPWTTASGLFDLKNTERASYGSNILIVSPSNYEGVSLSFHIQSSTKFFFPCDNTGFTSSTDSISLSLVVSSKVEKYTRIGDGCPGTPWTVLNLFIVSIFLRVVPGASQAISAAPLKSPLPNRESNLAEKSSSAPGSACL